MTRPLVVFVAMFAVVGAALAQQSSTARPDPRTVKLRGDRFRPLTYDEMTPEQKRMIENLFAGPRGQANGPFNVLLRSPEIGNLAQEFGASTRFKSSLPPRLYEIAILVTARYWTSQYEWEAHNRSALQAGISPDLTKAIAEGRRPAGMKADEEAIYNFSTELLNTHQVSDATFNAAKKLFGERGVVDLVAVMGWYNTVSMLLNVDRYPVDQPQLKPLGTR